LVISGWRRRQCLPFFSFNGPEDQLLEADANLTLD
jgi:hypothetical protein